MTSKAISKTPALPKPVAKSPGKAPSKPGAKPAAIAKPAFKKVAKPSAKAATKPVAKPVGHAKPASQAIAPKAKSAKAAATSKAKAKSATAQPPKFSHGGKREGAGRPPNSGILGPSVGMRIPRKHVDTIRAARDALAKGLPWPGSAAELPLFDQEVRAGFPTPSDDADSQSRRVDLYTLFSPNPESTFLIRVAGWSMREAGIHDGDYLVVDRSIEPRHGHVVVAYVEGQGLLAKRLRVDKSGAFLDSDNKEFAPIPLGEGAGVKIWGVARAKAGMLL